MDSSSRRGASSCAEETAALAQYIGGLPPVGTSTLNFSVPGVAAAAGLSTIFTCTNPSAVTINVAVETFDQNGLLMNASPALAVPPGGTVQFATTPTAPFLADQYLNPVSGFTRGAAKIWSSSKVIHCGAMLASSFGGGQAVTDLPLIAQGKKQRGD